MVVLSMEYLVIAGLFQLADSPVAHVSCHKRLEIVEGHPHLLLGRGLKNSDLAGEVAVVVEDGPLALGGVHGQMLGFHASKSCATLSMGVSIRQPCMTQNSLLPVSATMVGQASKKRMFA